MDGADLIIEARKLVETGEEKERKEGATRQERIKKRHMSDEIKQVKDLIKDATKRKVLNDEDYKIEARDDLHQALVQDLEQGMRLGGDCNTESLTLEKMGQFQPLDGSSQQPSGSEIKKEEFNTAFKSFLEHEVMSEEDKKKFKGELEKEVEVEREVEEEWRKEMKEEEKQIVEDVESEWIRKVEKEEIKEEEKQVEKEVEEEWVRKVEREEMKEEEKQVEKEVEEEWVRKVEKEEMKEEEKQVVEDVESQWINEIEKKFVNEKDILKDVKEKWVGIIKKDGVNKEVKNVENEVEKEWLKRKQELSNPCQDQVLTEDEMRSINQEQSLSKVNI